MFCGGVLVVLAHRIDAIIGRFTQISNQTLQLGNVRIGVFQFWFVKHFAFTRIVVEIVIRDNFGMETKFGNGSCKGFLCTVHPYIHGMI